MGDGPGLSGGEGAVSSQGPSKWTGIRRESERRQRAGRLGLMSLVVKVEDGTPGQEMQKGFELEKTPSRGNKVKSQLSRQDRYAPCALGSSGMCPTPALRPPCWPPPGTSFSADQIKAEPVLGGAARAPRLLHAPETLGQVPRGPRGPRQDAPAGASGDFPAAHQSRPH